MVSVGSVTRKLRSQTLPWVEKYRPKSLSDVSSQPEAVSALKDLLRSREASLSMPHLMFFGPAGTGKTSTALALCSDLWGPQWRDRVLELNASDERGIQVIRTRVRNFASISVSTSFGDQSKYPCPPFKVIILDEADALTSAAQSALRRLMEDYALTTRFILLCNYPSKILPPIASRCARFHFRSLPLTAVVDRLKVIAASEDHGGNMTSEAIEKIAENCEGDMRRAVTLMQAVLSGTTSTVTADFVDESSGILPSGTAERLIEGVSRCQNPQDIFVLADDMIGQGHSVLQIVHKFSQIALNAITIAGKDRGLELAEIVQACAVAETRLTEGVSPVSILAGILFVIASKNGIAV